MRISAKCCVLILAATVVALALRLPRLAQRPMHGDEAVHADKFAGLLERGSYTYDPHEYHGPTLNYLSLIPAWLSSARNLTQVTEFTLRIVPVVCGVVLVLLLLLIADGLGPGPAGYAAVLTAVSGAMVFYSRYYIQEMLLVCFTFGAIVFGYRYARRRNILWAVLTGVCLGLMHATKETCIIAFGSMALALWLSLMMRRREDGFGPGRAVRSIKPSHFLALLGAAVLVSVLFYSSFFSNPMGIVDSVRTYATYFNRAGVNELHVHPWYYYLKMLIYSKYAEGPVWSEGFIVLLAIVGIVATLTRRGLPAVNIHLLRFVVFYTLTMTILYSVIRYKTPWCMLGFLHGMILLAGVGGVVLARCVPNVLPRLVILFLLFDGAVLLLWQAYLGNYKYYADSRNPYVYAHPTTEVFEVVRRAEQLAALHEDGRNMPIEVICPGDDYWPLPWYLREFSRVYWRNGVDAKTAAGVVIIASPAVEDELTEKLYELTPFEDRQMYMYLFEQAPYYVWLRPEVGLMGFVRKDLWDRWYAQADPNELTDEAPEK